MHILLINPSAPNFQWPPLGLGYLASSLRKENFVVDILDIAPGKEDRSLLEGVIKNKRPQIIGVTCLSYMYPEAKEIAKFCRKQSKALLVVGGAHATALPERVLRESVFDIVVLGEGELTLLEIAREFSKGHLDPTGISGLCYRDNGTIKFSPPRALIEDLNEIPWPAYDLLYSPNTRPDKRHQRKIVLMTSRGCPYQCIFCANGSLGRKTRFFSAERVAEEIEFLMKNFGFNYFLFVDDNFLSNKERLRTIFEVLKKKDIKIKWQCQAMLSRIDFALLQECERRGCQQISYGLESADEQILNKINKRINLEEANRIIQQTKEAGIRSVTNVIIGFPWETQASLKKTLRFVITSRASYPEINILTPMPGSELWKTYAAGKNNSFDWKSLDFEKPIGDIPNFTQDQLHNAYYFAYLYVFRKLILRELLEFFKGLFKLSKKNCDDRSVWNKLKIKFPALNRFIVITFKKQEKKIPLRKKIYFLGKGINWLDTTARKIYIG